MAKIRRKKMEMGNSWKWWSLFFRHENQSRRKWRETNLRHESVSIEK